MVSSAEPLLARPSTDQSSLDEEDELLTGDKGDIRTWTYSRWVDGILATWAIVATVIVIVLAVLYQHARVDTTHRQASPTGKRNLIFMVSDGMGPTSLSLTRSYRQYTDGLPWDDTLTIDNYVIGQSRTRSTSSLVTDSAAGATAFSCGKKSYNGAISMLPDHTPCGSVMEAAKRAGYMTGLVVTTRITDATPAVFAAHVNRRSEEDLIAEHLLGDYPLGQSVDLMLGAGRCHFLPNTTSDSCRADDKDMIARAKAKGFAYIGDKNAFEHLDAGNNAKLPLLGLFADHDIPYEIDRRFEDDTYPSLEDMAKTAIQALSIATKDSEQGFFLMIEGSRIDHAGHANDPAAQVHEVLAYDRTMDAVLDFVNSESTPTVMVSTSDHETGGLATARQLRPYDYPDYLWYPAVLANASHSTEWLTQDYAQHLHTHPGTSAAATNADNENYIRKAVIKHLGIHDASDEEIRLLLDQPQVAPYTFGEMISRRAQIGWSTHGHSAADVNIYTSDPKTAKALIGNRENTEVGQFLADYLAVDVDAVTEELKKAWLDAPEAVTGYEWMGILPQDGERLDGQSHEVELDHYQGDFKKHKRCELCNA